MLLYYFISIRIEEVHKSIAWRGLVRVPSEDRTDIALEVREILDRANTYTKAIPSDNNILEVIYFTKTVLKTRLFRQYRELHVDKSTGKARGVDTFRKEFVELSYRSSYTRNITIRAYRR
ncbi:uncharacterized protein N7458_009198 [Penicillium daleae]|uniref:Uncharacterized protein n=1 Tax=Penicillium daleae TaxID=63821 RepID=A0AAD6BX23_9EURO|nr:uncharacterized protein N7458_009198 [Penicillium daleae]KAJ5438200.1 hypothetical protein N7458_009198 [Penicillium daleae]